MGVEYSEDKEINQQDDDEFEIEAESDGEGEQDADASDSDADESDEAGDEADDGDDEQVVVTIDGEESAEEEQPYSQSPAWLKDLRRKQRETAAENRRLKEELAARQQQPKQETVEVGAKPKMDDDDIDYDAEKFEKRLLEWNARKQTVEQNAARKQAEQAAAQQNWNKTVAAYNKAKTSLKVANFEDAEAAAFDILTPTQQGIIIDGIPDPAAQATMIYALGRNPKKAKEIAAITNPVKFAFAISKLESQLKVTARKTAPIPDKPVRGSAPVSGTVDKKLEALETAAEKSGDRSKVIAYKKQIKASKK